MWWQRQTFTRLPRNTHHFRFCIVWIRRCAKNGHTIINMNQVGDISENGHHTGYFSSKILDLFIDVLVVKFNTFITISMFTFFLSCWFLTSVNARSSKLMRAWICCTSDRIESTVLSIWLIVDAAISIWCRLPPFMSGVNVCELPPCPSYEQNNKKINELYKNFHYSL